MNRNRWIFSTRAIALALWTAILLAAPALGATAVVKERPRLFVRAADVPALKDRCRSDEETRKAYELARRFAYSNAANPNLWVAPDELSTILLVYLLEDRDPKLLARAKGYLDLFQKAEGDSWTRPRMLKALAHAYDWLHPDLSEAERKQLAARMVDLAGRMRKEYRHSDYNNHVYLEYGPLVYAALALWGDGLADDFAQKQLAESEKLLKEHFIPAVNQVGGEKGDKSNLPRSGPPGASHKLDSSPFSAREPLPGGWHESMSYWSFFAYELAHQMEAWRTATGEDLFRACPALGGAADWLVYCTRPHDGSMAPVADINTPNPWGWQETALLPLLAARYRDGLAQWAASQVEIKYASHTWPLILWRDPAVKPVEPKTLPTGTLFPGIGWAAMRGSWQKDAAWAVFVCGDYYAGHQHSDQNSFVISRGGNLAIDGGEYGAKATEFHNTVLIGGGQRLYGNDPRQRVGPTAKGSEFDTGDILVFEEHGLFTYVVGKASNAHGHFRDGAAESAPPRFVRRFLFVKPDVFVVDDDLGDGWQPDLIEIDPGPAGSREQAPEAPVRWLLHARNEPAIAGRTVTITDGATLTSETLLPEKARIEARPQSGGKKNEKFWRIDVTPQEHAPAVRFLHVLRTGFAGDKVKKDCKLVRKDGEAQLTVTHGDRIVRLWLPDDSWDAGEIEIASGDGKTLLARRPLAGGVLPFGRSGPQLMERWDASYREGRKPGWDTGRPASDLVKAVEDGALRPCRVVELGCGTGTNAIYLASKGFDVTALDIAPTALALAKEKAAKAGVKVRWVLADVLAPPDLGPFDLVFDRGCYHGVRRSSAAGYVEAIRGLTKAGSRVFILAGNANEQPAYGPPRVKEEELRADFAQGFKCEWLRETRFDTMEPGGRGALAWSVLLRRE